jgi:hypothetical protein
MQYKTAQNPATITSMVDGAPKRNELGGNRAWFLPFRLEHGRSLSIITTFLPEQAVQI